MKIDGAHTRQELFSVRDAFFFCFSPKYWVNYYVGGLLLLIQVAQQLLGEWLGAAFVVSMKPLILFCLCAVFSIEWETKKMLLWNNWVDVSVCMCVLCICSVYGFHTMLHPLCFFPEGLRALKCIQPQSLLFSTWTVSSAVLGVKLQLKVWSQAQHLRPGACERHTTFRWNLSPDFYGILAKTCVPFWESDPLRKNAAITQNTSNCCKLA